MLTFLSEIHFWTIHEDVIIKDTDYGSYKYYSKKDISNSSIYAKAKIQYIERNGITHLPNNKRPDKLRDRLKELEDYLVYNKVIFYHWVDNKLKLLLSTGIIVNLTIHHRTGDLLNITFDKQLTLKLQINIICDGVLFDSNVICACNDGHVFGYGPLWKDGGWVLDGGPPRRQLHQHGDWLIVYGKTCIEHPQPWSPLGKDHQRANLHLYWIGGGGDPELLAYRKTDGGEPLLVIISKIYNRMIIVIEQKVTQKGAVSVDISTFELMINNNNLRRTSITSVPLQTQVSCCALSNNEERVIMGCIDGSLALLDRNRGTTRTVKAAFIPTLTTWHPDGVVVVVANERGQLQYYDAALNTIKIQLANEDDCISTNLLNLTGYFQNQFNIISINWNRIGLILSLEQGPLVIIKHADNAFSFNAIAQSYIKSGHVDKAIKLLLSWDFNDKAFIVLQTIVIQLLRKTLTAEIARQLQDALGSFHNPPIQLTSEIKYKYGRQVMSLTRRFFHQLVRSNMFETAFLLAVDVGHHDLFMDLFYIAVKIGETELAAAARAQASALVSWDSSDASNCSRSSCSQCSNNDEDSNDVGDSDANDSCNSSVSSDSNIHKEVLNKDRQLGENKQNNKLVDDVISQQIFDSSSDPLKNKKLLVNFNSDNKHDLTTDFNCPNPTTYKSEETKELHKCYDVINRKSYPLRATYVKAPQVPPDFVNLNQKNASSIIPPLPFLNASGLPYIHHQHNTSSNYAEIGTLSNNNFNIVGNRFDNSGSSPFLQRNNVLFNNNYCKSSANRIPSSSTKLEEEKAEESNSIYPVSNAKSTVKKHQIQVKFSDIVTAFIVPEVKRSTSSFSLQSGILASPPSFPLHLTSPQKELAESLPLCHPNDDYLKDFMPATKKTEKTQHSNDNNHNQSKQNQQETPPKIKVVHFGVV